MQLSKSYEYVGLDKPCLEKLPMSDFRTGTRFDFSWLIETFGIDSLNSVSVDESINSGSPIPSGGRYRYNVTNLAPELWQDMGGAGKRAGYIDEVSDAKIAALKDTQTIYLDIKRIAYITSDDEGTVTFSICDQLVQHIELTKNIYGEYSFGDSTAYIDNIVFRLGYSPGMLERYPDEPFTGQSSVQFW